MAYNPKKADLDSQGKRIILKKFFLKNRKQFYDTLGNIKAIDGAEFDKTSKKWTVPFTIENAKYIEDIGFQISDFMEKSIQNLLKPFENETPFIKRDKELIVNIEIGSDIIILDPPEDLIYYIKQDFEIDNPLYKENQKQGRSNHDTPRTLRVWDENQEEKWVSLSRGCERLLYNLTDKLDITCDSKDFTTYNSDSLDFSFSSKLRDNQIEPCKTVLESDSGVLCGGTGFGKTVCALYIIAKRQQRTMVIVHTKELLYQWEERCKEFLDYTPGLIGSGKFSIKQITIATVQTINKREFDCSSFGFLVVDECHRTPSSTFLKSCQKFSPFYILGLSATPYRRDGLAKFIFWTLGDLVYNVSKEELMEEGAILRPEIMYREFNYPTSGDYMKQIAQIVNWRERTEEIIDDVQELLFTGKRGIIVLLADRTLHLDNLSESLSLRDIEHDVLTGKIADKKRRAIVKGLNEATIKIVLATASLLQEGFDCKELTYIFICSPIKYAGKLVQIIGRAIRPCKEFDKKPVIYDYKDAGGIFNAQFESRKRVYDSYK